MENAKAQPKKLGWNHGLNEKPRFFISLLYTRNKDQLVRLKHEFFITYQDWIIIVNIIIVTGLRFRSVLGRSKLSKVIPTSKNFWTEVIVSYLPPKFRLTLRILILHVDTHKGGEIKLKTTRARSFAIISIVDFPKTYSR